ncbi:MAG TPA: hypothetical protein DDX54_01885 [Rhodospirillaceae bacterium]|jgi:hypothetical protein|nr:phasin family protein [Alphaproteobacteria bacterium]HBH26137.1 hypothetical protein [Rhodospirillaceae bacterium]
MADAQEPSPQAQKSTPEKPALAAVAPPAAAPKPAAKKPAAKKPATRKAAAKKSAAAAAQPVSPKPTITQPVEAIMTNQKTQIDQAAAEAAELGQEYVASIARAGSAFAERCEDILHAMTDTAQQAARVNADYMQRAMVSPTLNTLAEVSQKTWEQNLSMMMESAGRISDLTMKALSEASAPLAAQASKAAETVRKSLKG